MIQRRPTKLWVVTDVPMPPSEVARELLEEHPGWLPVWVEARDRDGTQNNITLAFLHYLSGRNHAFRRRAEAERAASNRPIALLTRQDVSQEFARLAALEAEAGHASDCACADCERTP